SCEAVAKILRRIVPCENEEIVEGNDGPPSPCFDALIQCMEEITRRRSGEQSTRSVRRQRVAIRTQKAMRAVAEAERFLWPGACNSVEDLARIHSDAGKMVSDTVSGVECDCQRFL